MIKIEEPGLFEADLRSSINLFLGSGFSTLAQNREKDTLPIGGDLGPILIKRFGRQDLENLDLQSIYTIIAHDEKEELDKFLGEIYEVDCYESLYDSLRKLHVSHVYTTNIDNLAYKIFRPVDGQSSPVFHDVFKFGEPLDLGRSIQYIPLHGSVEHEEPDYIFTGGQIASAFASDQQTWFVFQRELQRRSTIFLGYGMADAGVLQALHNASQQRANRWILVLPEREDAAKIYRSLGFHVLFGTIKDFLQYLETAKIEAEADSPAALGALGRIPRPDETAQRPVKNFFLGAEPTWSDAYSPNVERRSTNSRVLDLALGGQSVAIVGLPLSGKSTILKQVAVDLSRNRQCLFFDRLTEVEANEVVAEHSSSSTKPIVFIDQFIDSRPGFDALSKSGGFKFVVAESSVFYDSINHRRLATPLAVVSCSDVSRADLQRILASMPVDVKRDRVDQAGLQRDIESNGLFESLVRHIFDQDLRARFRRRLAEFEKKDTQAFDAYLMACYVHKCRTLVSYDMLHMFLSPKDYVEGYNVVGRIREFISEAENIYDDTQDHFSVRSAALSRLALGQCSRASFRRVFDKFHRRVGPKVIPDYITFRRYAYDNEFAIKAYPDFRDGKVFYEHQFARDDNAYDYQHGAIYMSKLEQFGLAFDWIEKALSKVGSKRFSIRNSHAVILFDANFSVFKRDPSDATAFDGIRRSMEVLEACISDDQSRRYHLLRFADQAMHTVRVKMNSEIEAWLSSARDKLSVVLQDARKTGSREVYNIAKYKRLLREIETVMMEAGILPV